MGVSSALDLVIGLLFISLVFSLLVSGIYEAGARLVASRSRVLWKALRTLLDDATGAGDQRPRAGATAETTLTDRLYAHPFVRQLEGRRVTDVFKKSRVGHIPTETFSRAIVDILVPATDDAISVQDLRTAIATASIPDDLKRSLLPITSDAEATLDQVRRGIGSWFDTRMAALSRYYKRNTRWIMVAIGFVVVVAFNVDAIGVTRELYGNDAVRAAISEQAAGIVEACGSQESDQREIADCAQEEIDAIRGSLTIPVGWTQARSGVDGWRILGWLIAAVAVAQGAPFWFDLTRRASGIRR